MKTIVIISAVIFSFIFTSCEHQSGNLIGSFKVIKKVSSKDRTFGLNQAKDWGDIYLVSSYNDTVKVLVSSNELYLNTKVGDVVLVGKHKSKSGGFFINNRVKRFEIGYCKIIEKINNSGFYEFKVVSRGEDTIKVNRVSNIVYLNTSVRDFVFVKKDRGINTYYTE